MQDLQASSGAFKARWSFFLWPLPGGLALGFPRQWLWGTPGYPRAGRSLLMDQTLIHWWIVLLPVDAANHNSSIEFLFFWVKKYLGFFSVSTITEGLMNLIS